MGADVPRVVRLLNLAAYVGSGVLAVVGVLTFAPFAFGLGGAVGAGVLADRFGFGEEPAVGFLAAVFGFGGMLLGVWVWSLLGMGGN